MPRNAKKRTVQPSRRIKWWRRGGALCRGSGAGECTEELSSSRTFSKDRPGELVQLRPGAIGETERTPLENLGALMTQSGDGAFLLRPEPGIIKTAQTRLGTDEEDAIDDGQERGAKARWRDRAW
jgi:hypothetical protein